MKNKWLILILVLLFVLPVLSGCGDTAEEVVDEPESEEPTEEPTEEEQEELIEPIVLSLVDFRPATHSGVMTAREMIFSKIEENTNGQVIVEWMGGPDVMNPSDVGLAIQRGSVDVATIYLGAYEAVVPGVGALMLTELTPDEERESGAFDFISQMHEEAGIKYLGRPDPQEENFFFTYFQGVKPETIEDFASVQIGTAAGSRAAVTNWGAQVVNVAVPENYTSMEQNIVDGLAGQPLQGAVSGGWHELTDYVIDHPYYQSTTAVIMNLDKWNSIPPDLQDIITETMAEAELEIMDHRKALNTDLRKQIEDTGAEFYTLSPDVAEWYMDSAYEGSWEFQMERFPEVTEELRELLTK